MSRPSKVMVPAVGSMSFEREATEGRLAGTGFPHQTDAFPRLHEEVDAVDRLHMTLHTPENSSLDREVLLDRVERQDRRVGHAGDAHAIPTPAGGRSAPISS